MESNARQQEFWREFYERAWATRAALIHAMIDAGEANPYRIFKRLEAHERKFRLSETQKEYERLWKDQEDGPTGLPPFRATTLRGHEFQVSFHATANLHNFIIDYIAKAGPYDSIVELGCGYGRNLFEIFYCGGPTDIPYFGGELTDSGVTLGREIAALKSDFKPTFFHFDYLNPDVSAVPKVDRALVFTVHSIEQVHLIDPGLFHAIAGIGRHVTCLHFEPFGYQVADLGPATKAHSAFAREHVWNHNFVDALFAARDRDWLTVQFMATELFLATDPLNPTSLAIWELPAKANEKFRG